MGSALPAHEGQGLSARGVVLVTGGASGIGHATVERFIQAGWNVVVGYYLDNERDAAANLVERAQRAGAAGAAVQADVSRDEDCRRLAAVAAERFGRLDVLVCSAGTTRIVAHTALDELTLDDFVRTCTVNTAGAFQVVRACASALRGGEGGSIVIVSSYGAIFGTGSSIAYAASKGATNTLTMSLARVMTPQVRVNAVCPALVAEGLVSRLNPALFEARRQIQIRRAPLQKIASPQDVAADIFWLATGAVLMTGNVLTLDCGLHLNGDG